MLSKRKKEKKEKNAGPFFFPIHPVFPLIFLVSSAKFMGKSMDQYDAMKGCFFSLE